MRDILKHFQYPPSMANVSNQKAPARRVSIIVQEDHAAAERRHFVFLSHYKTTGGEAARVLADTLRRLLGISAGPRGSHVSAGPRGSHDERAGRVIPLQTVRALCEQFGHERAVYLDSSDLSDKDSLSGLVRDSVNYVLLLTRGALEQPWVLLELLTAHAAKLPVHMVRVEGNGQSGFRFPDELERAKATWTWYVNTFREGKRARESTRARATSLARAVLSRRDSGVFSRRVSDSAAGQETD